MKSEMYGFILNMWIMGRIEQDYVKEQTRRGRITEEERDMIMAAPRI